MKQAFFCMLLAGVSLPVHAGDLTERYNLTLKRILAGGPPAYSPEFVLADAVPREGRRFTEYSGDVSGRYVGALAMAAMHDGKPIPALDNLMPRLFQLQKPEGFFGAAFNEQQIGMKDMALLWGNGRMLIGLLEYYRAKPNPATLAAARKIGDFFVRIAPTMNDDALRARIDSKEFAAGYICWTHNLEGMVELYRITKDERYLAVSKAIAARTVRYPKQHSHGFLSSVRGIVDLYNVAGDKSALAKAEAEWQGVIDSGNLMVQGGIPEAFAPNNIRTEGCSEADWLRLSLALWQATGKAKYVDNAELTLFNEYAMNQFNTGDFGHRVAAQTGSPLGAGNEGGGTARAWWCCTMHGLRGFCDVFTSVFRVADGKITYGIPADGRVKDGALRMTAESTLEQNAGVRLRVDAADAKPHTLAVRQPAWASAMTVAVNGKPVKSADAIAQVWKAGDIVSIRYTMKTRVVRNAKTKRVAVFHGPWLLGIDEAANPYFYDEPHRNSKLRVEIAADGALKLKPAVAQAARFTAPVAHFEVPYLPGGYAMSPAKAVLRPVAEQTSMRSSAWEFWFLTEKE